MKYTIQNIDIELNLSDKVFQPSPHGSDAMGRVISVTPQQKVLDVGTGTGLLAIFAAKKGAEVFATDISKDAVELARVNAARNKVSIDIREGDLFSPFQGEKFDVIIANVPQELLSPKLRATYTPERIVGMHGGKNGNELLMRTLKDAPHYMHPQTKLYVIVYAMNNARESFDYIVKNFQAKLVGFYSSTVKDFLYEDQEWYEERAKTGMVNIYKNQGKYYADLYVLELQLKL